MIVAFIMILCYLDAAMSQPATSPASAVISRYELPGGGKAIFFRTEEHVRIDDLHGVARQAAATTYKLYEFDANGDQKRLLWQAPILDFGSGPWQRPEPEVLSVEVEGEFAIIVFNQWDWCWVQIMSCSDPRRPVRVTRLIANNLGHGAVAVRVRSASIEGSLNHADLAVRLNLPNGEVATLRYDRDGEGAEWLPPSNTATSTTRPSR